MRLATLLLASCVLYAQTGTTGKPGVTDPIKDPQQLPGKTHPGPMPRSTPQPSASAGTDQERSSKNTKKPKKPAKQKSSQPVQ